MNRVFARGLRQSAAPRRVAFLGLGNMGAPMASNLAKAGFEMAVFDPIADAAACAAAGLPPSAASAEAAVADAEVVVSMLPDGKACTSLYIDHGLLDALRPSAVVLDCSTIDAPTARQISEAASARGVGYLDAPVSGGTAAAAAANLAFMCGGSAAAFERAKPVLAAMGPPEKAFFAGPAGSGQIAKACNNMLLAIHMIGSCEALAMGAQAGLEPAALSEILRASSGRCWTLEVYNPVPGVMPNVPASRGYAPGFMVDLMVKDLRLAMEVAGAGGVDARMGALAAELYASHQAAGSGARDFSSMYERLHRPAS